MPPPRHTQRMPRDTQTQRQIDAFMNPQQQSSDSFNNALWEKKDQRHHAMMPPPHMMRHQRGGEPAMNDWVAMFDQHSAHEKLRERPEAFLSPGE